MDSHAENNGENRYSKENPPENRSGSPCAGSNNCT